MSWAQRRSRSGSSATDCSSAPTRLPAGPRASRRLGCLLSRDRAKLIEPGGFPAAALHRDEPVVGRAPPLGERQGRQSGGFDKAAFAQRRGSEPCAVLEPGTVNCAGAYRKQPS